MPTRNTHGSRNNLHAHSQSVTSMPTSPKPSRRRPHASSDTIDVRLDANDNDNVNEDNHEPVARQQIYVLSADGSQLFLLDPTKPSGNEEPPPYAPFRTDVTASNSASEVAATATSIHSGPTSPRNAMSPPSFPGIVLPPDSQSRHRSSTLSAIHHDAHGRSSSRPSIRNNNSFSHTARVRPHRSHSAHSSPGVPSSSMVDETTPLLARDVDTEDWVEVDWLQRRKFWKAVFCGEIEEAGEDRSWKAAWRRFWRPVGQGRYWKSLVHLWLLNFPFVSLSLRQIRRA